MTKSGALVNFGTDHQRVNVGPFVTRCPYQSGALRVEFGTFSGSLLPYNVILVCADIICIWVWHFRSIQIG